MKTFISIALVLMLVGCQTPMQSGSQCTVEPGSISNENLYSWRSDVAVDLDDATGYVGPLAVKAIEAAVVKELGNKGLELSDRTSGAFSSADLEVSLLLRTRRELVAFENNASVCTHSDCWERIDTGSQTRMEIRTIGFLAADVFYKGEPIWRGWVETYLFPKDRDAAEKVIGKAIPRLFETFPP